MAQLHTPAQCRPRPMGASCNTRRRDTAARPRSSGRLLDGAKGESRAGGTQRETAHGIVSAKDISSQYRGPRGQPLPNLIPTPPAGYTHPIEYEEARAGANRMRPNARCHLAISPPPPLLGPRSGGAAQPPRGGPSLQTYPRAAASFSSSVVPTERHLSQRAMGLKTQRPAFTNPPI